MASSGRADGEFFDDSLLIGDQGKKLFHLGRKPTETRIPMVMAAGLVDAVAPEKGPVLWTRVFKPPAVFLQNDLAQAFKIRVGPRAIAAERARPVRDLSEAELSKEGRGGQAVADRSQLQAIVRQTRLAVLHASEFLEQIDHGHGAFFGQRA